MRVELSRFTGRRSIGANNEPFVFLLARRPMGTFVPGPGAPSSIRAEPNGRNGDSCTAHPRPGPQREIPCRAVSPSCTTPDRKSVV